MLSYETRGEDRTKQDRTGLGRIGQDKTAQDRTGKDKRGGEKRCEGEDKHRKALSAEVLSSFVTTYMSFQALGMARRSRLVVDGTVS